MSLEYKILWFEDVPMAFRAKSTAIKRIIEDLGFRYGEPRNEIDGSNIDQINFRDFDLMIVDLNLNNKEKGSAVIERIRSLGVYTEVVFYSSQGEDHVRNELAQRGIEGAYCASREDSDFQEKVRHVIETTVKKVQDLNNMRGVIMAGTSDIEKKMKEVIQIVLDEDIQNLKEGLVASMFESVSNKVTEKYKKVEKAKLKADGISTIVNDNLVFDASVKLKAVQYLLSQIADDAGGLPSSEEFGKSYSSISKKRNLLGHEPYRVENGVKVLGDGGHKIVFNDAFCTNIRKEIYRHEEILNMLKKRLGR